MAHVEVEWREGFVVATLRREATRNAISAGMLSALVDALDQAADRKATALVIRGSEGAFSSGLDLNELKDRVEPEQAEVLISSFAAFLAELEAADLLTIAAVKGHVVAGGIELLLACDLSVCSNDAVLADHHARGGLVPGAGGVGALMRAVGRARANLLLHTDTSISGIRAAEWGLVSLAVPTEEVDATAFGWALGAPSVIEAREEIKRLMRGYADASARQAEIDGARQYVLRRLAS